MVGNVGGESGREVHIVLTMNNLRGQGQLFQHIRVVEMTLIHGSAGNRLRHRSVA